ncbi:MAG: efflux RND transporter periplasmic adaptor subunit [Oligoflexia bacterium]|nr:efflux RND transporter periplasmic adaptor subunit [Oligoflexia bacterium]
MKGKWLKWTLLSLILIIIIVGILYFYNQKHKRLDITYIEEELVRDNIEETILSTGVVQPKNRLEIKAPIAGRLENILVKEGDIVRKGQILAWMSSLERAALLDSARARGTEELKHWEDLYKPVPIVAPMNGTIILRNVENGQTFTVSDSVFVMSDMLTVKAQVDETDISQIVLKQSARVVLDAYSNETIMAYVDKIAFDAKTVNNVTTYVVEVLPTKIPPYMKSGMTANVTFIVASKENVLTISAEAIKFQDGKKLVMLKSKKDKDKDKGKDKGKDEKGIEQLIETGITDGKSTEVVSGLSEGDIVLVAEMKIGVKDPSSQKKNPFSLFGKRPKSNSKGGK